MITWRGDRVEISCIMPAYNAAAYVCDALESAFSQTWPPVEVIVVDDGSTDGTADIVTGFSPRVRYLREENAGPAAARNRGMQAARGNFFAFLDADDLWHPEKLARQAARFDARPDLDYCLTYKRNFWEACARDEELRLRREDHIVTHDAPGYVLGTLLAPRKTFEKVGALEESILVGEDTDWLARAQHLGMVREILEDVLLFRRLHDRNLSYQGHTERGTEERLNIVARQLQRLKERDRPPSD